jgi:hypothetical protein
LKYYGQEDKKKVEEEFEIFTEDSSSYDSDKITEVDDMLLTVQDQKYEENLVTKTNDYKNNTISIKAIEFDWLLTTKKGEMFLQELSNTTDLGFFEISTVIHIINFMWKRFLPRLFVILFFPFIVFFVVFIIFATYMIDEENKEGIDNWASWDSAVFSVGMFLAVFQLFFVGIEIVQFVQNWREYLQSFWNLFDLLSIIFNYAVIAMALSNADFDSLNAVAVIAIFFMWARLFYLLRVFDSTSYLVNMIFSILRDMLMFMVAFILSAIAFGNCLYILGRSSEGENFTGDDIWKSFIYSYNFALGNLGGVETFGDTKDEWLVWLVFVMMTLFTNIILLNLVIAIITETFEKVQETQDTTKLRDFALIMRENEFLIDRKRLFGNIKYIVVAEPNYEDDEGDNSWEGKLKELKKAISSASTKNKSHLDKFEKRLHKNIEIDMSKKMKPYDDKIEQNINYFDAKLLKTFENTDVGAIELRNMLKNA